MGNLLHVDPRTLHLPPSRMDGADPVKLSRQIAKHGAATQGMPPLLLVRGKGGRLQIIDGVTRATRVAKLLPAVAVAAEVIEDAPRLDLTRFPTIGDKLP